MEQYLKSLVEGLKAKENMLDDLKRCAISEENERRLAEIEDALFNLDYDAIIAAADTRKERH